MAKYIPLSLVIFSVLLPAFLAGKPRSQRPVRTLFMVTAIYIVVWAWMCLHVYTLHVFIE